MFACHMNLERCISRVVRSSTSLETYVRAQTRILFIGGEMMNTRSTMKYQYFNIPETSQLPKLCGDFYKTDMVQISPPVSRFKVHLDNRHSIYLNQERGGAEAAAARVV